VTYQEGEALSDAPKNSLMQWLASPAVIIVPLALVTLRVMGVAHGNYTTELALINDGKPLTVILGSLAPVAPYFVMYVALAVLWRARGLRSAQSATRSPEAAIARFNSNFLYVTVGLVAVLVVLVSTPLGSLAFALIAVCIWFLIVTFAYTSLACRFLHESFSDLWSRHKTWLPTVLTAALAMFVVFQLGLDDSMWVPPEIVHVGDGWELVYVLDTSGPSILAMDATNRTLVNISAEQLANARLCYQPHGSIGAEANLTRTRSLLQILHVETHLDQTSCGQVLLELQKSRAG
jgi:hypothetical protein